MLRGRPGPLMRHTQQDGQLPGDGFKVPVKRGLVTE
jgi:hypothetical protein